MNSRIMVRGRCHFTVRILLVDNETLVRQGLRSLLADEEGFEVVSEAGDVESALSMARQYDPDVIVSEINLRPIDGLVLARRIEADKLSSKVLFLTNCAEGESVTRAFSSGAHGYLLKDSDFRYLVEGIRTVHVSGTFLGPKVSELLVRERSGDGLSKQKFAHLTAREKETLRLLAEGNSSKDIAYSLGISNKTVDTFRRQCLTKLGLKNDADLIRYAIRHGMAPL